MSAIAPPFPSHLAAIRLALIDYLSNETGFDWNWYKTWTLPENSPKGAVFFDRSAQRVGLNYAGLAHQVTLQILIADSDGETVQNLLLDWSEILISRLDRIRREGISGTFRGVGVTNAAMGCRLTDSGIERYLSDANSRSDIPANVVLGTIRCQGEFIAEVPAIAIPIVDFPQ